MGSFLINLEVLSDLYSSATIASAQRHELEDLVHHRCELAGLRSSFDMH